MNIAGEAIEKGTKYITSVVANVEYSDVQTHTHTHTKHTKRRE